MRYPTGTVTFFFPSILRNAFAGASTLSGIQDQIEIVGVSWTPKGYIDQKLLGVSGNP